MVLVYFKRPIVKLALLSTRLPFLGGLFLKYANLVTNARLDQGSHPAMLAKYQHVVRDMMLDESGLKDQFQKGELFDYRPKISVILPVYKGDPRLLSEAIDSVLSQTYQNIELCIADDNSDEQTILEVLKKYEKDKRVKVVFGDINLHISGNTNRALEIADGEFIALMDHDDYLWPNALFEIVGEMNKTESPADFYYTDEDQIIGDGPIHTDPAVKPGWSPQCLESCNYITHFAVIRRSIVDEVGGLRDEVVGTQDWDLFLRIMLKEASVVHIPKILYSWRIIPESTASGLDAKPYVVEAQMSAITNYASLRYGDNVTIRQLEGGVTWSLDFLARQNSQVAVCAGDTKTEAVIMSLLKGSNAAPQRVDVEDVNQLGPDVLVIFAKSGAAVPNRETLDRMMGEAQQEGRSFVEYASYSRDTLERVRQHRMSGAHEDVMLYYTVKTNPQRVQDGGLVVIQNRPYGMLSDSMEQHSLSDVFKLSGRSRVYGLNNVRIIQ